MNSLPPQLRGNVLITGGSGFLGRGIMRQAALEGWSCGFTVFSRDENKQDFCRQKFPDARYIIGSVDDVERLTTAMAGHDYVIHAAALKYIPEGELNVAECVRINVGGAANVIRAARAAGVRRVVGISTDKAVYPINVYGMTKALMERMFGEAAHWSGTVFTTCRYGNVVGSTGSVVPKFRQELARTGHVTITSPDMTRFWISIEDAVHLIVAAAIADAGCTVITSPRAMALVDLAKALAGSQDRVVVSGIRPGEKLHEDMLTHHEATRAVIPVGGGNVVYIYPPGMNVPASVRVVHRDAEDWFPYNSATAERMSEEEFLRLVEDAQCV